MRLIQYACAACFCSFFRQLVGASSAVVAHALGAQIDASIAQPSRIASARLRGICLVLIVDRFRVLRPRRL